MPISNDLPEHPSPETKLRADSALSHTPMMQQYLRIKAEHPDTLVFYRMGDFYELFFDDAREGRAAARHHAHARAACRAGEPVVMAGVPFHSVEGYLARLIKLRRVGRDLRAGRRRRRQQGTGRAQGGARRHARHADRHRTAERQGAKRCCWPCHQGSRHRCGLAWLERRRKARCSWPNAPPTSSQAGSRASRRASCCSAPTSRPRSSSGCRRCAPRRSLTQRPAWQFDAGARRAQAAASNCSVATLAGLERRGPAAARMPPPPRCSAMPSTRRAARCACAAACRCSATSELHRPAADDAAQPRADADPARRGRADAVLAARHLHDRHGQPRCCKSLAAASRCASARVAQQRHDAIEALREAPVASRCATALQGHAATSSASPRASRCARCGRASWSACA